MTLGLGAMFNMFKEHCTEILIKEYLSQAHLYRLGYTFNTTKRDYYDHFLSVIAILNIILCYTALMDIMSKIFYGES